MLDLVATDSLLELWSLASLAEQILISIEHPMLRCYGIWYVPSTKKLSYDGVL